MGRSIQLSAAAALLLICSISTATAVDNAAIAAAVGTAVTKALTASVKAANGPTGSAEAWQSGGNSSASPQNGVNVSMNSGGLSVDVNSQNGSNFKLAVGNSNSTGEKLLRSFDGVTGDIFNILMPWLPQNTSQQVVATSGPVRTAVGTVRSVARQAIASQLADKFSFVTKQSDLIKETVNKEISDYIAQVNGASSFIQTLIKNKGKLLTGAAGQLGQGVMGMRSAMTNMAADGQKAVQDKVESISGLAGQFRGLAASMLGDMGSTAGLLVDVAGSKAKAFRDVYTTSEGLAKAHVDATVQNRASALTSLLDKIVAATDAVESSNATGPLIDWKLQGTQTKLEALESALDKVAAAVKAAPTPSKVVNGKLNLLGSTRIGRLVTDPDAALEQLMGKIGQARSAIGAKKGALLG